MKRIAITIISVILSVMIGISFAACENGKEDPPAKPVAVTGVTLSESSLSLAVNGEATLTATVEPANAADKSVTWTSSAPAKATVDNGGKVKGVAAGSATITVTTTDGGFTAQCQVTVTPAGSATVAVTGVRLNKEETSLSVGGEETLIATVEPTDATNKSVTWTSSASEKVTVDDSGKIEGVAEGSATITATTADGGFTAECEVTVTKPASEMDAEDWAAAFEATRSSTRHAYVYDYKENGEPNARYEYSFDGINYVMCYSEYKEAEEPANIKMCMEVSENSVIQYIGAYLGEGDPETDTEGWMWMINDTDKYPSEEEAKADFTSYMWDNVFGSSFGGDLGEKFSEFTYDGESGLFHSETVTYDGSPAEIWVGISGGMISSLKIATTSNIDDSDVEVEHSYAFTYGEAVEIPQEVYDKVYGDLGGGAMSNEEFAAAIASLAADDANYTVEVDYGAKIGKSTTKIDLAKSEISSVQTAAEPSAGSMAVYFVTKNNVTAMFMYTKDSWGSGQYMSPSAVKEWVGDCSYDGFGIIGGFLSSATQMYPMLTFEANEGGGGTYSLVQPGVEDSESYKFIFDADNMLKSVELRNCMDGGSQTEMDLITVTFSDYGATEVTYPDGVEGLTMPEAPNVTEEEWQGIFEYLSNPQNANYTVSINSEGTEVILYVNYNAGIVKIAVDGKEYYTVIDKQTNYGAVFEYADAAWSGAMKDMSGENFDNYIRGFNFREFLCGDRQYEYGMYLDTLTKLGYPGSYSSYTYAGGVFTSGDNSLKFEGGKLVQHKFGDNFTATFSAYGETEITVPADRPELPQKPDKTLEEWQNAFDALKGTGNYTITVTNTDGAEDEASGKSVVIKVADGISEVTLSDGVKHYYIAEGSDAGKFVLYRDAEWDPNPDWINPEGFDSQTSGFDISWYSVYSNYFVSGTDLLTRLSSGYQNFQKFSFKDGVYTLLDWDKTYEVTFSGGDPDVPQIKIKGEYMSRHNIVSTITFSAVRETSITVPENRPDMPRHMNGEEWEAAITASMDEKDKAYEIQFQRDSLMYDGNGKYDGGSLMYDGENKKAALMLDSEKWFFRVSGKVIDVFRYVDAVEPRWEQLEGAAVSSDDGIAELKQKIKDIASQEGVQIQFIEEILTRAYNGTYEHESESRTLSEMFAAEGFCKWYGAKAANLYVRIGESYGANIVFEDGKISEFAGMNFSYVQPTEIYDFEGEITNGVGDLTDY